MKRMSRIISTLAIPIMRTRQWESKGPSMRRLLQVRKRTVAFALGIFVFSLGTTWIAWAQVGLGGTVVGCVDASGKIRAVDETTGSCRPSDVTLSWYTTGGANAAFLGSEAKAADADKLDGMDSTEFIRNDSNAGGALTGTYPNPSLGPGAVDTSAIQDGAVTGEKLGRGARNFGDSKRMGPLTPQIACGENDIGSIPITVHSASRVYASASVGRWDRGTTGQSGLVITGYLWDASNTTRLARTPAQTFIPALNVSDFSTLQLPNSGAASGILMSDDNLDEPFVAAPGTYHLHFNVTGLGGCFENAKSFLSGGTLTFMLLGTSP